MKDEFRMKKSSFKLLVITPVKHIEGVCATLNRVGSVTYMDDPTLSEVMDVIENYDGIFTNPNKSRVYVGKELIDRASKLRVICTASTGTNHIDKSYVAIKGITILSLTEEREIIERISSTAELAFALTMVGIRSIIKAHQSVLNGEWDYTQYIGRQLNCMTVGVVGFGRLGSKYAHYCESFGAKVLVYDPYKKIDDSRYVQLSNIEELLGNSDIVAIHVHVTDETINMFNQHLFSKMKKDVLLVNTSRGDIVDEEAALIFLKENPNAKIATDVLADEVRNRKSSKLLMYALTCDQIIITPHIGGMTREAQEIAYNHSARSLLNFLTDSHSIGY